MPPPGCWRIPTSSIASTPCQSHGARHTGTRRKERRRFGPRRFGLKLTLHPRPVTDRERHGASRQLPSCFLRRHRLSPHCTDVAVHPQPGRAGRDRPYWHHSGRHKMNIQLRFGTEPAHSPAQRARCGRDRWPRHPLVRPRCRPRRQLPRFASSSWPIASPHQQPSNEEPVRLKECMDAAVRIPVQNVRSSI